MERDTVRIAVLVINHISTHTLTWSVTRMEYYLFVPHMISTHTLTWSVTNELILAVKLLLISTHTLTWSVTFSKVGAYTYMSAFQLTRSRGA